MKVKALVTVTNIFNSQNGRQFISGTDMETGGQFKLSIQGAMSVREGHTYMFDVECAGRLGKDGGVYLNYMSGGVQPYTVDIKPA